ncbi:hypothetical protein ScPMuIL_007901, partial [Solemya velum]
MDFRGFILFSLWISTVLQQTESCGDGRFGNRCQFQCHCRRTDDCEQTTGECRDGQCDKGWMGKSCQYRNLVYGKTVLMSSTESWSDGNSVTDGDNSPSLTNGTCGVTTWQNNPRLQIRFDWKYTVEAVRLFFPEERVEEIEGFVIDVGGTVCYQHVGEMSAVMDIACGQPLAGYYISVLLEGYQRLSLCELEVYQGRNVAFGKTSLQSSEYTNVDGEVFSASLAVDGSNSGTFGDISCTHTQEEYRPWWRVDLGSLYKVRGFNIYNRREQPWRLMYFQVFIGNTTDVESAQMIHEDKQQPPPNVTTVTLMEVAIGRYFFVRLPAKNSILTLCEVEVFGDCIEFLCGLECGTPCPCSQPSAGSRKMEGVCAGRCQDGWMTSENRTCGRGACSENMFGPDCEHECHCTMDCNPTTGECLGGTDFCQQGWDGPFCQRVWRENFALRVPARRRNWGSSLSSPKLTDGDEETCPLQAVDRNTVSFEVDLPKPKQITNIRITKKDKTAYGGLEVFVGQTQSAGIQCTVEVFDQELRADCRGVRNRYITVQRSKLAGETQVSLALCELEAYECTNGTFGYLCDKFCHCKSNTPCDKVSGMCPSGTCHPGWQGSTCSNKCQSGNFGTDCRYKCTGHCKHGTFCHHIDGWCPDGCQDGWQGPYCEEACDYGRYGKNCESTCGLCKGGVTCDARTGLCAGGCDMGKWSDLCNMDCIDGDYGEDCREKCGHCYQNSPCNKRSGRCGLGCGAGWQGDLCVTECGGQSYGVNCAKSCGHCYNNTSCDRIDGRCLSGCSEGWRGNKCDVECQGGTYGLRCSQACGHCVDNEYCHIVDGVCQSGCQPGWKTPMCNQACDDGTYGKNCGGQCGYCADGAACDKETGVCNSGCAPGWTTAQCHSKTDYINASYIDGFHQRRAYVACQGPIESTQGDFWRMVWQLEVGKVVMLTGLVEGGRTKCQQYWPDAGEEVYAGIHVRTVNSINFPEFDIRTFEIHTENSCRRTVKHFHFTSWPDMDVPEKPSTMVHFWNAFRTTEVEALGPVVVHCSAGIGRTGTFLALDYLVDEARANNYVQIVGCVQNLRFQRVNMVQTEKQYKYLHEVLIEALTSSDSSISAENFSHAYQELFNQVDAEGKTKLEIEFEVCYRIINLQTQCIPPGDEEFTSARDPRNSAKNRSNSLLASDNFRPYLHTPGLDSTNYINAVFLPGHRIQNAYIVTQMPLPDTIVDLWRLVYEQGVQSIIKLNDTDIFNVKSGVYWPEGENQEEHGPFTVVVEGCECTPHCTILTLSLTYSRVVSTLSNVLTHICHSFWDEGQPMPSSPAIFLQVLQEVRHRETEASKSPVLVQCYDGAERSGLFCVLTSVLEKLRAEQRVDIRETVKKARCRRPEVVGSL